MEYSYPYMIHPNVGELSEARAEKIAKMAWDKYSRMNPPWTFSDVFEPMVYILAVEQFDSSPSTGPYSGYKITLFGFLEKADEHVLCDMKIVLPIAEDKEALEQVIY